METKIVTTLAERCARYVKACGKRSILECMPPSDFNLDVNKMIFLKPSEINSVTGNPIARNVFEVPKAPKNWVTLTHCSRSGAENIKKTGLYYYTAGDYHSTTLCQDLPDLLDEFTHNPSARGFYGDDIIIFQMPSKEYKLGWLYDRHYANNLGYNPQLNWNEVELLVPPEYVVAHLERKDIVNMTAEQIEAALKSQPAPLDIKPTDLRHLNPGRPFVYKNYSDMGRWERDEYNTYKRLAEQEPRINISDKELLAMVSPTKKGVHRKETPMMKEIRKRKKEEFLERERQAKLREQEELDDFDKLFDFDEKQAPLQGQDALNISDNIFDFEF